MSKQTKRVKESVIDKFIEEKVPDEKGFVKVSFEEMREAILKEKKEKATELAKKGLIEIEIGIDCMPFTPRPSTYLSSVLEDTGIEIDSDNTDSRLFGAWIWTKKIDKSMWTKDVYDLIFARLAGLYERGSIRGAKLSPTPE
jgi:hypothetical protein